MHFFNPSFVSIFIFPFYFSILFSFFIFFFHRRNLDEKLRYEEKLQGDVSQGKSDINDRDRQLTDAKSTMDKYLRDYDALFTRTQKV